MTVEIKERIEKIKNGEIPEGYIRCEIGIIPKSWEMRNLSSINVISTGATPLRSNAQYFTNGKIPWVKTTDLNNSSIFDTEEKITECALSETSVKWVSENSILIAMYGGFNQIGRTGLMKIKGTTNQAISSFYIDEVNYNSGFVLHWLNANRRYWKRLAGSSRKDPNIKKSDVEKFPIAKTKYQEQQKIAAILSIWDKAIELKVKLIGLKKEQKRGLMEKLLTGEVRFPGFEDDWKEVELGDMVECYNSKSLEKYFNQETGLNVISIGNYSIEGTYVYNGNLVEINEETKKYILNKNDLAMVLNDKTKEGRIIGRVLLIDEDNKYIFNQRTARLVVNNEIVLSKYLYYLINGDYFHQMIFSISQGGTQIYININPLLKLKTIIPELLEQEKIIRCLDTLSRQVNLLQRELEALKLQKKGLMQLLLTGIVRVKY
ncbi:MAG: hypothetical protein VR72_17875 [Clostridiaceae bacterium BRH_c20a]|nr:MAG: hypothetical protein VR72_17875 [Clostridiaceae bacterium BRH_c20a]